MSREFFERGGALALEPELSMPGAVFDSLREMVLFFDSEQRVVWGNKSMLSYAGRSLESAVGRKCNEVFCRLEVPCAECPIVRSKKTGGQESSNIRAKDGRMFFVRGYPVRPGKDMSCGGFIEIAIDISAESSKERDIEEQRLKLMQAEKLQALATIISGVAHEINNPLSFMTMNLPLLMECWRDAMPALDRYYEQDARFTLARLDYPSMRDALPRLCDDILSGALRLKEVIADLKDYVMDERGEAEEALDVNRVVEKSLALTESILRRKARTLYVDLKPEMPKARLNPQRLAQVMVNLLINASQQLSGDNSEIRVSTGIDSAKGRLLIRISYEGAGCGDGLLGGESGDSAGSEEGLKKPLALDLSISKRMLESISGSLEVERNPGGRSSFTVLIPACPSG